MLELKEINFPNKKSVCVRKKVVRKSLDSTNKKLLSTSLGGAAANFIKVSNHDKDAVE